MVLFLILNIRSTFNAFFLGEFPGYAKQLRSLVSHYAMNHLHHQNADLPICKEENAYKIVQFLKQNDTRKHLARILTYIKTHCPGAIQKDDRIIIHLLTDEVILHLLKTFKVSKFSTDTFKII